MPRNISFMLTEQQFLDRTKTVTRRLGWLFLQPGDILNGCRKCQGLKKGEKIIKLGQILVVNVDRQPLQNITSDDCIREGFPNMTPVGFVDFFCKHMKTKPSTVVTRIEFEHLTNEGNGL